MSSLLKPLEALLEVSEVLLCGGEGRSRRVGYSPEAAEPRSGAVSGGGVAPPSSGTEPGLFQQRVAHAQAAGIFRARTCLRVVP